MRYIGYKLDPDWLNPLVFLGVSVINFVTKMRYKVVTNALQTKKVVTNYIKKDGST